MSNQIKAALLTILDEMKKTVPVSKQTALAKTKTIIQQSKIEDDQRHFEIASYFLSLLTTGFKQMNDAQLQRLHTFGNRFQSLPDEPSLDEKKAPKSRPPEH